MLYVTVSGLLYDSGGSLSSAHKISIFLDVPNCILILHASTNTSDMRSDINLQLLQEQYLT